MANSAKPGPQGAHHHHRHHRHTAETPQKAPPPPQTPGVQGRADQGDPTWTTLLGWTPNITGVMDWADHSLQSIENLFHHAPGAVGADKKTGAPVAVGSPPLAQPPAGDLDLSFLGDFVGGELAKADIEAAAKELGCEPGPIYAIAKQESSTSSFVTVQGRQVPTILYERHWFRKLTKPNKSTPSPYEADHPDICGPAYHKVMKLTSTIVGADGKKKKVTTVVDKETQVAPVADDIYLAGAVPEYTRLCKAYKLDKSAALQSASWGKFQIMGFNFKSAGFSDVFAFVKAMSTGDPAHLKAFLKFAKSNKLLLDGLKNKDYEKIAEGHNGSGWRTLNPNYASNLKKYSEEYK